MVKRKSKLKDRQRVDPSSLRRYPTRSDETVLDGLLRVAEKTGQAGELKTLLSQNAHLLHLLG